MRVMLLVFLVTLLHSSLAPQRGAPPRDPFFVSKLPAAELQNKQAVLDTSYGTIVLDLLPEAAPNHVALFITRAREGAYRRLVQDAFGLRRKQLRRVVRTIGRVDPDTAERILQTAHVDPESRPETLSPDDFARLLAAIESVSGRGS